MKDKEKQIEEMAKEFEDLMTYENEECKYCGAFEHNACDDICFCKKCAEYFVSLGYRKIDKEYEVFNCRGNGQCQCKSCKDKGKYYVSWTDWFWKLTEDSEAICFDCLKEKLEEL